ncbi:MAG: tail fiber protein [Cytophagales bacterium]|nr:MAG: tail fiber protein [Cytophagales bacterium]
MSFWVMIYLFFYYSIALLFYLKFKKMKKINTIITAILLNVVFVQAQFQDQKGFNFQGYARDESGAGLGNKAVQVKYSLYPAGLPGNIDYTETHSLTTDAYGIFSAVVGSKSIATFAKLAFSRVNYWLKVEVKTSSTAWSTINEIELLSVPYARTAGNGNPIGAVIAFAGAKANIPLGYLICDGTLYNRADYLELSNILGSAWGGSATQFNVPDMRGLFVRGVDETAGRDDDKATRTVVNVGGNTGNTVGTLQLEETKAHNHTASNAGAHTHNSNVNGTNIGVAVMDGTNTAGSLDNSTGEINNRAIGALTINSSGDHTHTISSTGGTETRPENVSVYYIIKY